MGSRPEDNGTRCGLWSSPRDDAYRCATIIVIKRATAAFSLIGCIFMLLMIWLLRKYNSLAQKMIFSLTVAAFFDSIAYVMGDAGPDGALCNFQAWWLTYFDWSALAWVCCITLNLYLNVVKKMRTEQFERWYVPLFILIFLMMLCYLRIVYVAKQRVLTWSGTYDPDRERSKVLLVEEIKPLKWYPCVYLAVTFFPLLNRLHNAVSPNNPSFLLLVLHVVSAPLHGLANAIVFGLDKETWVQLHFSSLQLAFQSRFCDKTRIKEYRPRNVQYMTQSTDEDSDSCDDTTELFSLKDQGP
uniref:Cyclic AMP receptor-like protein A isoform X4 n=1 Tax=Geotrypetes seraphini TaxID=260995 RepID=A0A6P8RLC4_GEOSA|nr:cyclic AMP receptor-like protein A isoform X4 [Geotrypetes seraphini]